MHVFVAMPYGIKEEINFNRVYSDLIKPALINEGFEVFRADEEISAGNIRTDMFQELLLADLVVVDLSIDNPNVWYELGVRHGLRSRGVVLLKCRQDRMPFDVYTDRTLSYHLKDSVPDPDFLDKDKAALAAMSTSTISSWHGRKISPVYHLLRYLKEPDWKSLRVDDAQEFWQKQDAWKRYIEVARKGQKPGDILVLANEAPIQALRLEAYKTAGKALLMLGQFSLALEQIEKCLAIDPEDLESLQQKGIILSRLKKYDAAREWLESIAENYPDNPETWTLLGHVEKESWIEAWRTEGKTYEEMRKDAAFEDALLRDAIKPYLNGFLLDPSHYYSGINALTLLHLLKHLTGDEELAGKRQLLEGGVRWAVESAISKETPHSRDFWARVTLGDLEVLTNDTAKVETAYKSAVAAAEKDWFKLDSSRQQLLVLADLGFRSQQVTSAINIFDQAQKKIITAEKRHEPRLVLLFSGHRIDEPGRSEPRFTSDKIDIAAKAISSKLDELAAGKDDLGLCGGACGGDLLFAEACLQHGLRVEIRIPFDEPTFLHHSVTYAGDVWRDRFYRVKNHPNTKFYIMPEELSIPPIGINAYSRNNIWQLYTALAWTPEKVRFISLWNRKEGNGPGGTKHMRDEVLKHFGQVHILDTNELFKKDDNR
jgi:tetratricopeptide (TPR) repeat protein